MKRTLTNKLVKWKNGGSRKPFIIKGVKQCGKTYLLKEFGKNYYEDFAYFNFENNTALQNIFENDFDAEQIITELSAAINKNILPHKTLIIFDDIQFCDRALYSLKYFCENAHEYYIVAAGSLFDAGEMEFHTLYPMNFYEFLLANDESLLCEQLEKLHTSEPVPAEHAKKLEKYLENYYICGGMPEAVDCWINEKDIDKLDAILQKILDSYEHCFADPKISAIWNSIPAQIVKENFRAEDAEDALEWLISAGMIYKVAKIEEPSIPLPIYVDSSYFKIYMADIGLLRKISKMPVTEKFMGAIIKNFVLCELVNESNDIPFFWKSENAAEVDFVIQNGMYIVPIEVKLSSESSARSLAEYTEKFSPSIAITTSLENEGRNNVPLYMLWKIEYYEKILELNPDNIEIYFSMGRSYRKKWNYDKAIEAYEKIINSNPRSVTISTNAYNEMGFVYTEKGDYDNAIEAHEKIIKTVNPRSASAYNNIGLVYMKKGDCDKAIEYCLKSLELNSRSASMHHNTGMAYALKKDYDKALEYYQKALELKPNFDFAKLYYDMGKIYGAKGDKDRELEFKNKAKEFGPITLEILGGLYSRFF
jgi:predicted AAA+ superfamily ATPase/Tfp pilus assembly protein PilF